MTETCRHSPGESDEALRAGQRPSMRQTMTQLQRVAPVAARLTVASTAAALTGRAREPLKTPASMIAGLTVPSAGEAFPSASAARAQPIAAPIQQDGAGPGATRSTLLSRRVARDPQSSKPCMRRMQA